MNCKQINYLLHVEYKFICPCHQIIFISATTFQLTYALFNSGLSCTIKTPM